MKEKQIDKKRIIEYVRYAICAFVVSFVFVAGNVVDATDSLNVKDVKMLISFLCMSLIVFVFIVSFKKTMHRLSQSENKLKLAEIPKALYALPLVTWIVSWLALFPGVFSYDCFEEWRMIAENRLTSHHPVLHVLILGWLTEMSNRLFGTGNVGIAIYVFIQLAIYAFIFVKLMSYLKKYQSKLSQWIGLILYSFSPVILMYVTATTKDSIFAIFELWFIVTILQIEKGEFNKNKLLLVEFALSSLGTMILRKNGLYIVVVLLIYLGIKNIRSKKILITISAIAAIYFIYAVPFFAILHVGETSSAEMFAVPIQQLARVHRFEKESFNDKDLEVMYEIIPSEYWDKYIPSTVDSVKLGFDNEAFKEKKVDFFKVWIKQGVKNPMSYINAFLANTVDIWDPLAVNDGYRWLFGNDESKSNFFDYRVAEPGDPVIIISPLHNLFEYLSTDKQVTSKLLASIFLNPGWYILAWICDLLLRKFDKKRLPFHLIMALSLLSVLAGPMAMVRYVLIFYLILPLEIE